MNYEGDFIEINNIIALAKADDEIKEIVMDEMLKEFWDDFAQIFYKYYAEQGVICGT